AKCERLDSSIVVFDRMSEKMPTGLMRKEQLLDHSERLVIVAGY
ncbi:hypothetical protein C5167_006699, partial [Papaver somniferum]